MTPTTITTDLPRCGLGRRLAAAFYDGLLLLGVLFVAGAIASLLVGNALVGDHPLYRAYLIGVAFTYFGWPWVRGGQTLGMKTWRIRVVRYDGAPISPWQALLRFVAAGVSWLALGLGFLWSLWDRERQTWHDRFSLSLLVSVPKGE